MSLTHIEDALRDPNEGLLKWTSARTIRQREMDGDFPAVPDLKANQLPAILYNWQRRRGLEARFGPALTAKDGELIQGRINPGTFPFDIQKWYADQHNPVLHLLLLADPTKLPRAVTLTVNNVAGTFQGNDYAQSVQGERIVAARASDIGVDLEAWIDKVNINGGSGTIEIFGLSDLIYTEDGDLVTLLPNETITGQTTGATADIVSAVASLESLADLEFEVAKWFNLHATGPLQDHLAQFESIRPVPDLSSQVSTARDKYDASAWTVELSIVDRFVIVKRTIETVGITPRIKDVDGTILNPNDPEILVDVGVDPA